MEQRKEEDSVKISNGTYAVSKCTFPPSMYLSNYVGEKIVDSLTMISDSLTEVDDSCDPFIMVKSLLHHWVRIFLSMEIDIQYFWLKTQQQQLQEESKGMVEGSPIVDDKITDQLLLMDCNTGARSVGLHILQNAIEMSVTILHRKGDRYSLLAGPLALFQFSDPKTFQGETTHQKQPNKIKAAAAPTRSTSSTTSFSLFDLLDKNPQLYNNKYICYCATLIDEIVKSYNCHKEQIYEKGGNAIETWIDEIVKELEKMHRMDPDFVNHPDWSTIEEILLLGLRRYTSQLDVNNVNTDHCCDKKVSPITNIPIRYLQVHTSIIQALVQSRAIEEDTNTTIAVICGLLYNLLQTLKEIFFSQDNNSIAFVRDPGQTSFTLSTPLEKLVGQLILTSHYVAKDVLLPYWSHYTVSSDIQLRLEEITSLFFALYRVTVCCHNKWGEAKNRACHSFHLLPSHLFTSVDPYATLLDLWIQQLGPQTTWKLLMLTDLRNDLFKCISSAATNYNTTSTQLTQSPNGGQINANYPSDDISSMTSLIPNSSSQFISEGNSKRSICMLYDQKDEARVNRYSLSLFSPAESFTKENNISIIDLKNSLFIWALCATRSLICMFRLSIFIDSPSNDIITDEVIAILAPYLSVLKVGATSEEDHQEENLVQLCSDMVETVLNIFRPNNFIPATEYGTIYYYIAHELNTILIATQGSNIFTNPFSNVCLRLLHDMFHERLPLLVGRRSNLIDHRRAIVSQVIGFCHTFFNVQVANIDCEIKNNDANSLPTSTNKLDNSNKLEKIIPIVALLGGALYWGGTLENRHHSVITTSLHNFVKCASYLGLRREAYVAIALTLGRVQYSGSESIIERLNYVKECINFALDDLFLVMAVSNHHDIIMEKKGGVTTLLHAIICICLGTKNGGKFLIQNSWFQRLLPYTLSHLNFEDNEQTKLLRLKIPVILLSLGGAWSCSVVECNEIFDILENYTRTTATSDGSYRVIQHEMTSLVRLNFDFMFALLHRSLKPSKKDLDEIVQSNVVTSSTALLLALLNKTIMETYGTMKKGLDGVYKTKGISHSTKSINNLSLADSFIREIQNSGTTVSPKEVCLSFSSIMTAEFLSSINLVSATEAALFAPKMNDKLCQHTDEGSSGLKEYYGTMVLFLKSLFQFCQTDLSTPDNMEEGVRLFLGVTQNGQVFIDWLGIIVYSLCCGDFYKACDAIQILQDKPGIQILWPRVRLEKGCNTCLVSFLAEEILRIECPEVLIALEQSGCPLSIIVCAWQRQCFVGVLSFGEALLLQCISLLYGVDYLVYYAVCIILHMKKNILVTAANKDLLTLSCMSASDFRVAASFQCATKLCCEYRKLIFSLHDEICQLS
jgi:hypothetical protein